VRTTKDTVEFLLSQLEPLDVRARAMFGEYGFYCDEKLVALVCQNTFYLKPTEVAEAYASELTPGPPYPGASDYLAVDAGLVDDPERFQALVKGTADLLPKPRLRRLPPRRMV
jgi:TfoX/Sxy family transcriptional regulator of competence genes